MRMYSLAIVMVLALLNVSEARANSNSSIDLWCQNGGVGHPDSLSDWQEMDVATRIRDAANIKTPPMGVDYGRQQLREKFENRSFSCKFTVKADGSIGKLEILHSSGSQMIDKRGISLVQSAAPFWKNKIFRSKAVREKSYSVEFPLLTVKPLD